MSTKSQSPEGGRRAPVQPNQPARAVTPGTQPTTPGVVVVGWMLVMFAVIPLAMGLGDDSVTSLAVGAAMVAIGAVLVLAGRAGRRRAG